MGAEHFALECFLYQFRNALVQVLSSVVLGYQNPGYRKIRVQTLLHLVDYLHKFSQDVYKRQEYTTDADCLDCFRTQQKQVGGR